MLDNFIMGGPISDHSGVRCCPAMENETDEKYIVKVISIPASPSQMDALWHASHAHLSCNGG
jgi:hypothetical protein